MLFIMSKKSFLIGKFAMKFGQDFFDIQFLLLLARNFFVENIISI